MDPLALAERALTWLRGNPEHLVTSFRNALGLKLTVPLDALRFLAGEAKGRKAPRDVQIDAAPPGIRLAATLELMKTQIRAQATVHVDRVRIAPESLAFEVRLRDVGLAVIGQSDSPIAMLIQSGALDLSKPGKLLSQLPKRPPIIVEADGDRLVIDLMQNPKIAAKMRPLASYLTPVVTVSGVETSGDHLGIQLSCFPNGFASALGAIRAAL